MQQQHGHIQQDQQQNMQHQQLDLQQEGGGNRESIGAEENVRCRRSSDSELGEALSRFIAKDKLLEHTNSSCFPNSIKCEQPIAQHHSLTPTNLFTQDKV